MAAEEGYDAVAWTPGKIQVERYDLSTKVDGIEVIPEGNNKVEIMVKVKGEDSYKTLAINIPEDKIADHIGKELAEKAMKKIGNNSMDTSALSREYDKFNKRVRDGEVLSDADGDRMNEVMRLLDSPQEAAAFTGVDLEIGGEGMKGFYDKMLKNYASKWGKKFGAKVGVTKIPAVYKGRLPDDQLQSLKAAQIAGGHEVWTLPITEKMRDSAVRRGVPLFTAAPVGAAVATGAALQEERPVGDFR
jgi:DNA-binding ferritin-like protein (Dps family)